MTRGNLLRFDGPSSTGRRRSFADTAPAPALLPGAEAPGLAGRRRHALLTPDHGLLPRSPHHPLDIAARLDEQPGLRSDRCAKRSPPPPHPFAVVEYPGSPRLAQRSRPPHAAALIRLAACCRQRGFSHNPDVPSRRLRGGVLARLTASRGRSTSRLRLPGTAGATARTISPNVCVLMPDGWDRPPPTPGAKTRSECHSTSNPAPAGTRASGGCPERDIE